MKGSTSSAIACRDSRVKLIRKHWYRNEACQNSDDEVRAKEDYAACCCAVHNFSLCLWAEGIGVKWTTGPVTRDDAFYDLLWIDRAVETVVGLIWYGYAAETPMTARKSLAEVMVELP